MVTVFGKIPASIILGLDGEQLVYSADGKNWLEFDEYTKAEVDALLDTVDNKLAEKANTGVTDGLDARISDLEDSLGNLEEELAKI